MTNKQRILQMVERWPDDISFEKALYHVYALKQIDDGLRELNAGRVRDFDEVFDELERRCDEKEGQAENVEAGRKRPGSTAKKHRGTGRVKNGQIIRKPAEKVRKPTS